MLAYPAMSFWLNKTGRPILFSCSWPAYQEGAHMRVSLTFVIGWTNVIVYCLLFSESRSFFRCHLHTNEWWQSGFCEGAWLKDLHLKDLHLITEDAVICVKGWNVIQELSSSWDGRPWPQQTCANKMGGLLCPFRAELGPCLIQCGLGRGLLPYQVASSSI